eukprot:CAMPEP_0175032844 /NCGR_PEP_ID=MMETSP0005-20121125/21652_1 /TAXON_ID=420556 /ORGANISM="Ochromonas sp., Strain CCMP1393" /LENGTH=51 /DNA_ID=CAMNT_0016293361 /DNA_START=1 /DNA_END=153 /DNA_ORIENTATION=-
MVFVRELERLQENFAQLDPNSQRVLTAIESVNSTMIAYVDIDNRKTRRNQQ